MSRASGETHKPVCVKLYLPSQDREARPVADFDKLSHELALELAKKFGGITRYPATGYFYGVNREVEWEAIQVLEFFTGETEWLQEGRDFIQLALKLGSGLRQEAIAYSINGVMSLLNPQESDA